jgi:thioesterase domain-containing protein
MPLLDRDSLQAYLTARIAPARVLGLSIVGVEPLTIAAPLAPNLNDKGTAFAGSLYSAAALAGWALLTRWCSEESIDAEVALHDSSAQFLAPARASFQAVARAPGPADLDKLRRMLARGGRGRAAVSVEVICEEVLVMRFSGAYAVIAGKRATADPLG